MTNSLLKVRLTSARTSEEMDGELKIDQVLVVMFFIESMDFMLPKLLVSLLRPDIFFSKFMKILTLLFISLPGEE